ncbi:hypothetical protein HanPSC8_Chr17g0786651 [Helianthus annuus]|nr:hypothetical protein HanPSC8_Chr17g0786651 [Helianthus annuus]
MSHCDTVSWNQNLLTSRIGSRAMHMNPLCLKPMILSDFLSIKEAKILKMSVDKMSHRDTPVSFGESGMWAVLFSFFFSFFST